jgi:hypothetical protein
MRKQFAMTRKPNVVLVITDQQRFDTIRAAGGTPLLLVPPTKEVKGTRT